MGCEWTLCSNIHARHEKKNSTVPTPEGSRRWSKHHHKETMAKEQTRVTRAAHSAVQWVCSVFPLT